MIVPQLRLRYRPDLRLPGDAGLFETLWPTRCADWKIYVLEREVWAYCGDAVDWHVDRSAGCSADCGQDWTAAVCVVLVSDLCCRLDRADIGVASMVSGHDGPVGCWVGSWGAFVTCAHVPR